NFDLYGVAGVSMLSKTNYHAVYDSEKAAAGNPRPINLISGGNEVKVGPMLGAGLDFFLSQMVAFKIDARFSMFVDQQPQYDQAVPVTEKRLYNNFVASAGVSYFFPKMKPRMYNF